jgi:IS605 OrfB family transposase
MSDEKTLQAIVSSIRLDIQNVPAEVDEEIHAIMRRQQAAKRVAYNRLLEGQSEKDTYNQLCTMFPKLSGWDVNAAYKLAKATIDSQKALLPSQIEYLTNKIARLNKKKNPKPEVVQHIADLKERLKGLQAHIENGTVPPAVFGGKKLWLLVSRKVEGAKQQWQDARSDEYYSVGDSAKIWGNRHFRLIFDKDLPKYHFGLEMRVPIENKRVGKWVRLQGICSKQYYDLLTATAVSGAMITVRLKRITSSHFHAFVTINETVMGKVLWDVAPKKNGLICGIDLNLDHAAIALVDGKGQFRGELKYDYPNLGEMSKPKTEWSVGNIAKSIVRWAKENKISAFVLEDLKIRREYDPNPRYNRRTNTFAYRQLSDTIQRTALRAGINVKLVNPAYTSWIGQTKYAEPLGLSRHSAAAYVIARRGLGLDEDLPKQIVGKFPEIAESVEPKKQKTDGKKNSQLRTWHNRLKNWKENTPRAGRPWLLWATLHGIYARSGARCVL